MQIIDDYIRESISFAVEKMGGQPGDAVRIYRTIVHRKGFEKKIRYKPVNTVKVKRTNPVKSLARATLTDDETLIFKIIYEETGFTYEDIISQSRKRDTVDARKKAMVIFCIYLDYTYKKTGILIGGRDHSTVIHAINTHDSLLQCDSKYALKFKVVLDRVKDELSHYFQLKPITIKELKNDFDQSKWERFASKWDKEEKNKKELANIKATLLEYELAKAN